MLISQLSAFCSANVCKECKSFFYSCAKLTWSQSSITYMLDGILASSTKLFLWGSALNYDKLFGMASLPQTGPLPTTAPALQLYNFTVPTDCLKPQVFNDQFYRICIIPVSRSSTLAIRFLQCVLCYDPSITKSWIYICFNAFQSRKYTVKHTNFLLGTEPKPWLPSVWPNYRSKISTQTRSQACLVTRLRLICWFSPACCRKALMATALIRSRLWCSRVPLRALSWMFPITSQFRTVSYITPLLERHQAQAQAQTPAWLVA